jgi:hypothetical protein
MPEIVSTTVYRLDELDEAARARARTWFRTGMLDEDWYEFVYDDFEQICRILGVELSTRSVPLYGGGTRSAPCIWFSGFASQGDGACFEGQYRYARASTGAIRAHAPRDRELHRIADALAGIQRRYFYSLHAEIGHRGRYYHEYSMDLAIACSGPVDRDVDDVAQEQLIEPLRDLARWLYRRLECEYAYQTSDAVVDETILANDYSFTSAGQRFP